MRFYNFTPDEILKKEQPNFNLYLDPKANWAIQNLERFPVDVQSANLDTLLRVPGIGPKSARNILRARKYYHLHLSDLKKLGVVVKRAQYFVTCNGEKVAGLVQDPQWIIEALISKRQFNQLKALNTQSFGEQMSLFDVERFERQKGEQKQFALQ